MEFNQVSDRLVYKMPDKKDFPTKTTNWKDGLNNILAAVEKSDEEGKSNPIVLFKNDRYVCTYDMVSCVFFSFACHIILFIWYLKHVNIIFIWYDCIWYAMILLVHAS